MADISRGEMGLIIGLVLGTLFLALVAVLTYILYDKHRDEKRIARRLSAGGAGVDARIPPRNTGHNWTTINNSMVGLEMLETSQSQSAQGADPASTQLNPIDGGGGVPGGGRGNGGGSGGGGGGNGTRKSFVAAVLSWALTRTAAAPLPPQQPRTSDVSRAPSRDGGADDVTATEAAVTSHSDGDARQPASASPPRSVAATPATALPKASLAAAAAAPAAGDAGGDSGLAVVMVQLDGAEEEQELPLSGCLGDAVVSLALGPPVGSGGGGSRGSGELWFTISSGASGGAAHLVMGPTAGPSAERRVGSDVAATVASSAGKGKAGGGGRRASAAAAACVIDAGMASSRIQKAATGPAKLTASGKGATGAGEGHGVPVVVCRPWRPVEEV